MSGANGEGPGRDSRNGLPRPDGVDWRYALRLGAVPILSRAARLAGVGWSALGLRLGRESLVAQTAALSNDAPVDGTDRPLDIVFLTMQGGNHMLSSVEVTLGLALRQRGHRVRMVLCDQILPICEVKWAGKEADWARLCGKCYSFGRALLTASGLEVVPASRLAASAAAPNDTDWSGIVESTLLKHYRVGVLPDGPEVEARRALARAACEKSAAIGAALAAEQPDRVIMSHGIYSTWGPAREVLNRAGIPVVTYGEGKKLATLNFNWTESSDWWDVAEEWERVRDVPLTAAQERQLDDYLSSRRSHERDVLVYNFGPEETAAELRRRLGLDPERPTYGLFTNVLWDAASAQREIAFDDPVQWVLQTIDWFAHHREKQLLVKIHPAEAVIGTNQPFAMLIARSWPRLPDNIRVVAPDATVNSWSVIHAIDVGLVHTSTVGMELPLEGVPTIVVSETHFRGKGFTTDVGSRAEYFQLLDGDGAGPADRQRMVELARRYAYLLFERYQLPFPFLVSAGYGDPRALRYASAEELLASPDMALLVGAIEQRGAFLEPA